jgi:enoyl-CoA hydratase
MPAERAYNFGMVNRLSTREALMADVKAMADELATRPRLGNWLTKQALNHVEELRGKRTATDAHFHMHHFAHAQSDLVSNNSLGGMDAKSMAAANKKAAGEG